MTYEVYRYIFYGGIIACVLMVVLSIILFFALKIPKVIGDLSGRNAKKAIISIREKNEQIRETGRLAMDSARTEKITSIRLDSRKAINSNSGNETTLLANNSVSNETTLLSNNSVSNETTLLSNNSVSNETTLLSNNSVSNETTLLTNSNVNNTYVTEALSQKQMREMGGRFKSLNIKERIFVVQKDITFIHTENVI